MTNNEPQVTDRMQRLVQAWQETADSRAIFLDCYLRMTRNMLVAVDEDQFHDPVWVHALLHRFADYYFDALTLYDDDAAQTPAVWRVTHDAARQSQTLVLQNLLLGVNAHINYDLVFTLVDMLQEEWHTLSVAERRQRYADHCRVNDIIGRTIDSVQDEVIEKRIPALDIVDKLFGSLDEWAISRLISGWREEVWQEAEQLLATAAAAQREQLRREIEAATLHRANLILLKERPSALPALL